MDKKQHPPKTPYEMVGKPVDVRKANTNPSQKALSMRKPKPRQGG